jgi:hypothetical protein
MERRSFVAFPQDGVTPPASVNDLLGIVNTPPLLAELLREMDALWTVVTLGDPTLPSTPLMGEQRESYTRYRNQLGGIESVVHLIAALQNNDVRHRLTQLASSLDETSQRLRQHLVQIGINESSRLMAVFTRAFREFSLLLSAASLDNDKWYCHCYGLEILCRS